jgi:hypothetical protein
MVFGFIPECRSDSFRNERSASPESPHWYSRNQNRVTQTWLVCGDCNRRLLDTDFKAAARSAFESYQQALRPLMGNRQLPLKLTSSDSSETPYRAAAGSW